MTESRLDIRAEELSKLIDFVAKNMYRVKDVDNNSMVSVMFLDVNDFQV